MRIYTLLISFSLLQFVYGKPYSASSWGYDNRNGPSTWIGTCDSGHRQSPVDIRSVDVEYSLVKKMHFVNYVKSGNVKIQNNGHTVMVSGFNEWGDSQPFIFGGALEGKYRLLQIHFHWASDNSKGSEHTIGSLHYPVEAHFVHQKDGTQNLTSLPGDGLAVVGVFFTIQQEGVPFSGLEAGLRQVIEPNKDIKIEQYNPIQMLPNNRDNFYTYEGSLTTPKCDETVIWTVLAEPSTITKNQLNLLRSIKSEDGRPFEGNYRPTQSLNGRRIKYRSSLMDRSEICQSLQNGSNESRENKATTLMLSSFFAFFMPYFKGY